MRTAAPGSLEVRDAGATSGMLNGLNLAAHHYLGGHGPTVLDHVRAAEVDSLIARPRHHGLRAGRRVGFP